MLSGGEREHSVWALNLRYSRRRWPALGFGGVGMAAERVGKTGIGAVVDAGVRPPSPGMLAILRNRSGVISKVEPSPTGPNGVVHLVTVDFTDGDGTREETVIWEREPGARLVDSGGLPPIGSRGAMPVDEFLALVRSSRWAAIHPYVDPDGETGPLGRLPFASPFHGAIEVEDYQMVPLLKAMRMPRVSLLLADDVGLGKTIEAGLILTELVLQRRIQRILILTPASLRTQWKQELRDKFCLDFDIIDRARTMELRRQRGLDANPWRSSPHLIASYHYLKQADVLEDFLASCRGAEGSPHLPWDLLIVDEAHNLAPAAFGDVSDLTRMLRAIAPHFEHKLFATATPHNGRTRCFSGLLEILDPARFSQTSEFKPAERARVHEVVVRRLKSEINQVTAPPRFSNRSIEPVELRLSAEETRLSAAAADFRAAVYREISRAPRSERTAGAFAVEVLGKRLLSSTVAFADSWHRLLEGVSAPAAAPASEVRVTERAFREETGDDAEQESRTALAVRVIGTWLKPFVGGLRGELDAVTAALGPLGLGSAGPTMPRHDTRYDALAALIRRLLRAPGGGWQPAERLIIFTEFKTTLDYLVRRLRADFPDDGAILQLFGSGEMDERERDAVKDAFNDPLAPARVLVATDTASEGLNLQATARHLLHFDVPWNPSRLEQRNGRIDRYGQSRDVTVYHFTTDDSADLNFLAFIVTKVHHIREDIGATGEVLDAAVQRRLIENIPDADVRRDLERGLAAAQKQAVVPRDDAARTAQIGGEELGGQLEVLCGELDLDEATLRGTLDAALRHSAPPPRLQPDPRDGLWRLVQPVPQGWNDVMDDWLRLPHARRSAQGALPALAFDPEACIDRSGPRPIFRQASDVALLHLWHPVVQRALQHFARRRFPGTDLSASRWTVTADPNSPPGRDALILLTLEELGVNELRETFHHWIRTLAIPVTKGRLGTPLPHQPASSLRLDTAGSITRQLVERAQSLWADVELDLRDVVATHAGRLTQALRGELDRDRESAQSREEERFQSRQGELSKLITETRIESLERELDLIAQEQLQLHLLDPDNYVARLRDSAEAKRSEIGRLRNHIEDLRTQLQRERDRVMNRLIPGRYALRGEAQCLPVAVEIRLPAGAS